MPPVLETPGVYINEINAFPNSVVPVPTAVPAFVGYTATASYRGKSYLLDPTPISSMVDFMAFFGAPAGSDQFAPVYYPVPAAADQPPDVLLGDTPYVLQPDPNTIYYLYNCLRLFFENGGGNAWIVSVGPFGPASNRPGTGNNPNVKYTDLKAGLDAVRDRPEPTMIVIPDALLLGSGDYMTLMQNMLQQCNDLQDRVAIFDVQGADQPDRLLWQEQNIEPFRTAIGMNYLNYGIAYYPFLETTIAQDNEVDFTNLGGPAKLKAVLPEAGTPTVAPILAAMSVPPATNAPSAAQSENALLSGCPSYKNLHVALLKKINTLPPSAAMAGVYTAVDNARGVWKAPANVSLTAVVKPTLRITDETQQNLNVDAGTGKSINAIREFAGRGVMVWGARTLDGNSDDWRYVNVRRTLIWIEQSAKDALRAYVFEPNDASTWSSVKSMLGTFLTNIWKEGALAGASPDDAFSVAVGLGVTMTAQDILDGVMNVSINVAVSHPAEFIVINISQQLQKS
jgi:phage tail sheath protein FI